MAYEYHFKEDDDGNLVYYPRSYGSPGYTLTPAARVTLLRLHQRHAWRLVAYAFVYHGPLIAIAYVTGMSQALFWLLFIGPLLLLELLERRRRRPHWETLPLSQARLSFEDATLPMLARRLPEILFLIVVGVFLFLCGAYFLITGIGTDRPPTERNLAWLFTVFGLLSAVGGYHLRKHLRRRAAQGRLGDDDPWARPKRAGDRHPEHGASGETEARPPGA